MPKLTFKIETHSIGKGQPESYVLVRPRGFIDSSSCRSFERGLETAFARSTRFMVLDLSNVHYINSSGISVIIRNFGLYKEREGLFVLASVPKSVGLSMHLLGVTSLVPFHKDVESACDQFHDVVGKRFEYSDVAKGLDQDLKDASAKKTKIYVPLRRRRSPIQDAKVLLLVPQEGRFSRVLKLRFQHLNGNFIVLHDPKEALSRVDSLRPDLIVIDDRLDPSGDLVTKLKIHPERSLVSLIKIYKKHTDVERELDFKIWENDYLVDPFEILELFSLSEAELMRVPRDRKVFNQQIRVEFRTTKQNLEKAGKLGDLIIRNALDSEEDRTAMFAAMKEGIDNAVLHGNSWAAEKTIDVNFLVDRKKLTIMIEDQGVGFDYEYYLSRLDDRETFDKAKKRIMNEGQRGGLGILLMHRCTDRIDYAGTGSVLRLEKNLA